jgi:hypothetical protein
MMEFLLLLSAYKVLTWWKSKILKIIYMMKIMKIKINWQYIKRLKIIIRNRCLFMLKMMGYLKSKKWVLYIL